MTRMSAGCSCDMARNVYLKSSSRRMAAAIPACHLHAMASFTACTVILISTNPVRCCRTRDYLLTPEKLYKVTGFVPNVTFPCANIYDAETGRIAIYYGAPIPVLPWRSRRLMS